MCGEMTSRPRFGRFEFCLDCLLSLVCASRRVQHAYLCTRCNSRFVDIESDKPLGNSFGSSRPILVRVGILIGDGCFLREELRRMPTCPWCRFVIPQDECAIDLLEE